MDAEEGSRKTKMRRTLPLSSWSSQPSGQRPKSNTKAEIQGKQGTLGAGEGVPLVRKKQPLALPWKAGVGGCLSWELKSEEEFAKQVEGWEWREVRVLLLEGTSWGEGA